ncbi:hypothetical protein ES765_09380 [Maribacter sp. ACAM166]|nr:hypothetical protein ES765_09380 [Maribacter sp. ACAM166]
MFLIHCVNAQFTVDTELRPRFEYRHGFKTLFPDETDPAAFVSQRTRLNLGYANEKLNFYLSLQDVRVWGDVPQLNIADNSGLSIHQAWGEILLNKDFSLKLGRQEILYDDHRIFGNVGWAQQARSHDAALIKFSHEKFRFDLGVAFNQDAENLTGTTLRNTRTYKSMQYAWLHKDFKDLQASFLVLNNGMQFIDNTNSENNETRYSQTLGGHLKYSFGKIDFMSNLYYQLGKDVANNDINAYLLALEANYESSPTLKFTLGTELLSGNNGGAPENGKNDAFTPFYGTNHKFNGLMDYFYVGNHNQNVGLWDVYFKTILAVDQHSNVTMALHNFSSPSEIAPNVSNQLGVEADFSYVYTMDKNISLSGGYSHLFAAEGMEYIKNNFDGNTNNWLWVMVTITPILYNN